MREADPKQMSKSDLKHWGFGVDAMKMIEYDLMGFLHETRALPRDWDTIWEEQDKRDPKRVKVTISLDDDVVKFFKGLGPGYQPRINRVLRAFMHFRLAKIIEGPDTMDYLLRPEEVLEKARRQPEWGDTERMVEGVKAQRKGEKSATQQKAHENGLIKQAEAQSRFAQEADREIGSGSHGKPRKRVLKGTQRPWVEE